MISLTYFTFQTNLSRNKKRLHHSGPQALCWVLQLLQHHDHSCSDCWPYLPPPKNIFFIKPCKVVFLVQHKLLACYIKVDDKINCGNSLTNLSLINFINFLGANNCLSQCPRLGWWTKIFSLSKLFSATPHWNVTM